MESFTCGLFLRQFVVDFCIFSRETSLENFKGILGILFIECMVFETKSS